MSELLKIFEKLSEHFVTGLVWEEIEELFENFQRSKNNSDQQQPNESLQKILCIPLVQRSVLDEQIIANLLELCTQIRTLRGESVGSYDNTFDCWDQVVKVAPRDGYLAFVYTLAGLIQIDPNSTVYIKLSLLSVNAYFLTLTIPGAKGFHIFEEEIITHCLQVFGLIERIQNPDVISRMSRHEPIQIWVQFSTFCDDLKLVLRYVHFKEYQAARDGILKKLIDIQYLNHERGYANMCKYLTNFHVSLNCIRTKPEALREATECYNY